VKQLVAGQAVHDCSLLVEEDVDRGERAVDTLGHASFGDRDRQDSRSCVFLHRWLQTWTSASADCILYSPIFALRLSARNVGIFYGHYVVDSEWDTTLSVCSST
jgi:hypothetical protein